MQNDLSQYYALQGRIETGDLIEWRGSSIVGKLIRMFTKKDVNHSSLVVRLPFENCERRFIIEALATGLEFKLLSSQLKAHNGSAWWYGLKPEFSHLRDKIGLWAYEQLAENRGYDYSSLFKQVFGRVSLDARRFFCSEFVDAAYIHAGIIQPDPSGARRPGDFAQTGVFLSRAPLI